MDPGTYAEQLRAIERQYAPPEGPLPEAFARQVEAWRQRDGDREEICSTADATGGWLFLRLCARYGLRPYRKPRQKLTTLTVRAPQGFMTKILWPQFQAMMRVFAAANVRTANEILVDWLGAEEATTMLSVEEESASS
jgi:hypothetical protein